MLVDDNEINRFTTHKLLKLMGFNDGIIHFADIDEAISYLKNSTPQMLIIDFQFHEKDKFRILQAVEEQTELQTLSTIVLWDFDEEYAKQLSVLFPIEKYYQKPLKIEDAIEITRLALSK